MLVYEIIITIVPELWPDSDMMIEVYAVVLGL